MKNSKLILLLKSFNRVEWRRFGDFLASPFFNKRTELYPFYEYLKQLAPEFPLDKLKKEVLFQKFYPNQTFDNRALVHLNNYLLKQAEHFLATLRLEQEEYTINSFILEELMERKLEKHYKHYVNKSKETLANNQAENANHYLQTYQLADIEKRHFLAQKLRKYDPNLQATLDNLDQFYFLNKLKASCEMLEWKNIIAADFQFNFTDEMVNYLKEHRTNLSPIINIYLSAYHLLTKENAEAEFLALKALLATHQAIIPPVDKSYLYLFAINFCGLQIRQNNKIQYYAAQCLELYLEGVEQKFLYVNGYLSPWTFKNIVTLGFNLKKFEWTEAFIQTYYTQLEKGFQEDARHYNLADFNYRQQAYQEAQFHLMQVQYSDIFYNLGSKTMLIKIYYETAEEEALLSMIASFTIYLKRNKKMANNIRQTYLNFTSLLYQLLKVKPSKIGALQEKIKTTELLTDRNWLLKISQSSSKKIK